jgi:mRNA-degrading endonuclease toxin of MazEF toxin-antitoxin module
VPFGLLCRASEKRATLARFTNTFVAQITYNLRAAGEPTNLLVEVSTPEGQQPGLLHDSLFSCNNLATIDQALIQRPIGSLPAATMLKVDVFT